VLVQTQDTLVLRTASNVSHLKRREKNEKDGQTTAKFGSGRRRAAEDASIRSRGILRVRILGEKDDSERKSNENVETHRERGGVVVSARRLK
jgi:hypothetical protein